MVKQLLRNVASPVVKVLAQVALMGLAAYAPASPWRKIAAVAISAALQGALNTLKDEEKDQ